MAAGGGKSLTDCPSNLKEAIDWILRVTGKDGQNPGGHNGTAGLQKAVTQLLEGVKDSAPELSSKFNEIKQALKSNPTSLVDNLASGLATFIGYNGTNGLIGVDGIAVSNEPLERLRDAVLGFLAGFLGTLRSHSDLKTAGNNINNAIKALNGGVGNGKGEFEKAIQRADSALQRVNGSVDIKKVLDAVKEVSQLNNKTKVKEFAGNVKMYFTNVLDKVEKDKSVTSVGKGLDTKVQELKRKLGTLVDKVGQQVATSPINVGDKTLGDQQSLKTHIDTIYKSGTGALTELREAFPNNNPKAYALSAATYNATSNFLSQLQSGYQSHYQGATANELNSPTSSDAAKCGKILLSCLPLIFSNLQHLYWKCKQEKAQGGWKQMQLNGGDKKGTDLKHFMDLMAFSAHWLNGGKKGEDVERVMQTALNEFSTAAASAQSYGDFLKSLKEKATESVKVPTTNPLSALFYCSKVYFQVCQAMVTQTRPPSSIREMLYFLAAMPYSTSYEGLEKHIGTLLPKALDVADSGLSTNRNTLSADQIQECLTASCAFSSSVLGLIQGPGASKNTSEPWLFELFCNSAFQFKYPSGTALFSKVSNYAYALQFQLHFLYQQCSNTYTVGCGWRHCRFGKGINNGSKTPVLSHMCNGYRCSDPSKCWHNGTNNSGGPDSTNCTHNKGGVGAKCGTDGKASPLQAFLTDCLPGFSRGHPTNSTSHLSTCSGVLCHVPMGFNPNDLRAESNANTQGSHISLALQAFCGGFKTPLRHLSEKLGCLTKRTPRTLGDLFGFTWHLNGQLFNKDNIVDQLKKAITQKPNSVQEFIERLTASLKSLTSLPSSAEDSGLVKSLQTMAPKIPFLYQLLMTNSDDFLPVTFFNLKGTDHNPKKPSQYNGTHNDLYSLFNSDCSNPNTCGPYLYPLTHSDGATYAPRHASSYLSWVLYLSDDLQSWFQDMLDEFKNIDCKALGCVRCDNSNHKVGQHGTSSGTVCSCPSVVQCGGTLPLLYRHGFRYFNPAVLMGWSGGKGDNKRSCHQFAQQLQKVISSEAPLDKLITTIDNFLYAIRWEFFSKLSGFWTIYICIILYTFVFLLDTLRVRSHLHFPSSNRIAPISLLGTAKPPALKNFTKLVYFMP
ncbi:uncharacterized protein BcabD6B2_42090 [Babesia caballi]|uniref:Variant erythrocyte surface antigen-1, alpha subunit n=1 Tax=Babesia caballi TaxID=5871 RepID=A0AAV4LYD4_BABCB|nr:hypothetical protein, conserved [Babesia caballi]